MKKQTSRTDDASAPTFTGSQPKKSYTKAQYLALQESLRTCTHNPFQRVDGELLERLHKATRKHFELDDMEDALL